MQTLTRRLIAEALGTCLLVTAVVGSGIMAASLTDDMAMALLCNTVATAAALIVLISVFGPVSGAHFNPAVSVVMLILREMPLPVFISYCLAQITGGLAGTWLAHAMFELPILQVSSHIRFGASQWLAEFIAAFGLLVTILSIRKSNPSAVPQSVGLYIAAAYWFTSSTSFANPAVTIARAFSDTFSGIRPIDAPAFIVAQLAGALAAMVFAGYLFEGKDKH